MNSVITRLTGQDRSFYQSVITRVLEYKPQDRVNAGLIQWAARKDMVSLYTAEHVMTMIIIEDSNVFGEYDDDLNPIPCETARIRFYDPIYGTFYREEITILEITPEDYVALNITPQPGTFAAKTQAAIDACPSIK